MFAGILAVQTNITSSNEARTLILLLFSMLVGCVSAPQNGRKNPGEGMDLGEFLVQRTAFSGIPEPVYDYLSVWPDCTSAGMPVVTITHPASHGSLLIQHDVESYPNFPSTNQRYECNKRKSPSAVILYTPDKTYVGTDSFSVKVVYSSGGTRKDHLVVTVERPPKDQPDAVQR